MRAVAYARVSTIQQRQEGNIEVQRDAISEYATRAGFELQGIFVDDGISANDLENRTGLIDMLDFIDSGGVDVVLIYKLDRLARDLLIQEKIMSELVERQVNLVSLNDPDVLGADPSRTLIRQILGALAQYERAMITMRLMAGKRYKAKRGGFNGGPAPYGYDTVDADLVINPIEAETVKVIFQLRDRAMSYRRIAAYLNEGGFKSPSGGPWSFSTIRSILKRKLYIGDAKYEDVVVQRPELSILEVK